MIDVVIGVRTDVVSDEKSGATIDETIGETTDAMCAETSGVKMCATSVAMDEMSAAMDVTSVEKKYAAKQESTMTVTASQCTATCRTDNEMDSVNKSNTG